MKLATIIGMAFIGAASSAAYAQYTGPGSARSAVVTTNKAAATVAPTTVRALMASGKDDTMVSLQGRIVRRTSDEDYRFADSSGEIDLEIDDDIWPANTPIDDKMEVRILGEFDKDLVGKPKVEVERIEKVK
ncbi:NirD/YgiW/YdeI family stress tolerance protein [Massilia sp. PAMC28688]|uniref:YgiW/YdeI family stress tolerance OB fold protein n=1 Tax=Massilia sp. PAMC28688 TaxID=2861283 RepID=UPI001C630CA6|nr:NirD/YgiW/YdeI family stress tolerance protein [Massilia sp. PAMC28688]QYF92107.1 NirD/YgiW/YdeI family stress tolerance protein [Massilia sp. PAMC28688]